MLQGENSGMPRRTETGSRTAGPAHYRASNYPAFAVAADPCVLSVRSDNALAVLLVRRTGWPYEGMWALPGGFVRPNETVGEAGWRVLGEETTLDGSQWLWRQLPERSDPRRDPRMRVVSIPFLVVSSPNNEPGAGRDASMARWWPVDDVFDGLGPPIGFDHSEVIADAVNCCRSDLEYTTVGAHFLEEPFTIAELRNVYLAVWGLKGQDVKKLPPSNFHRKMSDLFDKVDGADDSKLPMRFRRQAKSQPATGREPGTGTTADLLLGRMYRRPHGFPADVVGRPQLEEPDRPAVEQNDDGELPRESEPARPEEALIDVVTRCLQGNDPAGLDKVLRLLKSQEHLWTQGREQHLPTIAENSLQVPSTSGE
jgi:8-oxo-dGTP diphosphatase